jgi:hypothetical protein
MLTIFSEMSASTVTSVIMFHNSHLLFLGFLSEQGQRSSLLPRTSFPSEQHQGSPCEVPKLPLCCRQRHELFASYQHGSILFIMMLLRFGGCSLVPTCFDKSCEIALLQVVAGVRDAVLPVVGGWKTNETGRWWCPVWKR